MPGGHGAAAGAADAEGEAGAILTAAGAIAFVALVALVALGGGSSVGFVLRSASQDSSNSNRQHGAERTASRYNTILLQPAAASPIYCILQALRMLQTGCIVPSEDDQSAKASK